MSAVTVRGRQARLWSWVGLVAIFVLGAVAANAPLAPEVMRRWTVAFYVIPIVFSILGASVIVLRVHGIEHRFWGLLALALAMLLAAELYWLWQVTYVSPRDLLLDHPYRLLHVGAGLLYTTVVVTMMRFGEYRPADRARVYLDIIGLGVLAYPGLYSWYVRPLFQQAGGASDLAVAMSAVYPVIGGQLLFAGLALVAGLKAHSWRLWERLISAAMGFFGVALVLSPVWNAQPMESPDSVAVVWFPIVLGAAVYCIFIGAVYRLTAPQEEELAFKWPSPRVGGPSLWSAVPIIFVAAVAAYAALSIVSADPVFASMLLWVSVALAAVVGARSWAAAIEQVRRRSEGVTDPVTGALDPTELDRDIGSRIDEASHHGTELVVAVVGLGGFDLIERRHGQDAADALLAEFATVLRLGLPESVTVYRWTGGSFALLFPGMTSDEATGHLAVVRVRARRDILDPDHRRVDVHAGLAVFPEHGLEADLLLRRAQRAELESEAGEGEPVTVWSEDLAELEPRGLADAARMRSLRRTVRTLAEAVDARDPATRHHSANVAELASALGQVLYLPDEQIQLISMAALLHDVGKIGIPDGILLKPGELSEEEREIVRNHAELGARILAPARMDEIMPMVRSHHEWWDGTGYPDGLVGHDIPIEARILALCDAFESMTTGRPYCVARSAAQALAEIERCAGTQFDPAIAAAFVRMVRAMGVGTEAAEPSAPGGSDRG